jgi:hypothetical protein
MSKTTGKKCHRLVTKSAKYCWQHKSIRGKSNRGDRRDDRRGDRGQRGGGLFDWLFGSTDSTMKTCIDDPTYKTTSKLGNPFSYCNQLYQSEVMSGQMSGKDAMKYKEAKSSSCNNKKICERQ